MTNEKDLSSKEKRSRRIIEAVIRLAEEGGFAAVRLRDVANEAGVALGTVYKRFQSKEDMLIEALSLQMEDLELQFDEIPLPGDTPLERVTGLFAMMTHFFCGRPKFARAVIRSISSADPALTEKVASFHHWIATLTLQAISGDEPIEKVEKEASIQDTPKHRMSTILGLVWFAALVGWAGGVRDEESVIAQIENTAELILRGIQ